jgi:pimeloyl-ACP methyl ester carboxylesterase
LDAIGADRFVSLGWSGGGPHALACAALLPDRCLATAVVAGRAPCVEAPDLLSAEDTEWCRRVRKGDWTELVKGCEEKMAKYSTAHAADMADNFRFTCEADREYMNGDFAEYLAVSRRDAFASGIEGYRDDLVAIFVSDWGFPAAEARRVAIWHGADDGNIPTVNGVWLAEHIPDAELHVLPNHGHVSIGLRFGDIYDDLSSRSQAVDTGGAQAG